MADNHITKGFENWYDIQTILRDPAKMLECAQRCADAYGEVSGWGSKPITSTQDTSFKTNTAGILAVVAVATNIAIQQEMKIANFIPYPENLGYMLSEILTYLAKLEVPSDPDQAFTWCKENPLALQALITANATWNVCQDWRERLGSHNTFMAVLDTEFNVREPKVQGFIRYDVVQIATAAQWLLEQLGLAI